MVDNLGDAGSARKIFKKSYTHLVTYYNELKRAAKHRIIMNSFQETDIRTLRRQFRRAHVPETSSSSLAVTDIIPSTTKLHPLASAVPEHAMYYTDKKRQREESPKRAKRSRQSCSICGHFRKAGKFAEFHGGKKHECTTPIDLCRPAVERCRCPEENAKRRQGTDKFHWHPCECIECIAEKTLPTPNPFSTSIPPPRSSTVMEKILAAQQGEETALHALWNLPRRKSIVDLASDIPSRIMAIEDPSPSVVEVEPSSSAIAQAATAPPSQIRLQTGGLDLSPRAAPSAELTIMQTFTVDGFVLSTPTNCKGDLTDPNLELRLAAESAEFEEAGIAQRVPRARRPLQCFVFRIRRGAEDVWLDSCEKEILKVMGRHKDNPLADTGADDVQWETGFGMILPQRFSGSPIATTPKRMSRWGCIGAEPARRAFWSTLMTSRELRCRVAVLARECTITWISIAGDGSCFYRSLLAASGSTYTNEDLKRFKLRLLSYFEGLETLLRGINSGKEERFIKDHKEWQLVDNLRTGWFGNDSENPSGLSHTFVGRGWGDACEYGPHIVGNSEFLLGMGEHAILVCINHTTAYPAETQPFTEATPCMVFMKVGERSCASSILPLMMVLSFLVLKHDDKHDPFDVRTDLCIVVYHSRHYSAIRKLSSFK
jgi:hypothetical protein